MTTSLSIKCPVCGKASCEKTQPFCSSRCATLDLGKWLNESYCVSAEADAGDTEPSAEHQIDEG